jgi:hypothetical protein
VRVKCIIAKAINLVTVEDYHIHSSQAIPRLPVSRHTDDHGQRCRPSTKPGRNHDLLCCMQAHYYQSILHLYQSIWETTEVLATLSPLIQELTTACSTVTDSESPWRSLRRAIYRHCHTPSTGRVNYKSLYHLQAARLVLLTAPMMTWDIVNHKLAFYKTPRNFRPVNSQLSLSLHNKTTIKFKSTQESIATRFNRPTLNNSTIIPVKMHASTKTTHVLCRETCLGCGKDNKNCTCVAGN